jgi:glucosyl-3-phosphoglycerate synthase
MMLGVDGRRRDYEASEFTTKALLDAKGGRSVSVVVPARDEATTVGAVVRAVTVPHLRDAGGSGLVDEVVVVDDGSTDDTAGVARAAGARGVQAAAGRSAEDDDPAAGGKGQAMEAGLAAAGGDVVVYLDADVENTSPSFVTGLLGPLLLDDAVTLVKGYYERPINGAPSGGGRVTELVARPLIEVLFPDLAFVRQPLAGETAAPRWVLEKMTFAPGYGVELGLLVDVARKFGAESIAQVDLGRRVHRNRPLSELRPQSIDVLRAALDRGGVPPFDTRDQPGR